MATARPAAAAPKADGRASATPILPPKSKAPLFIGLGAAAAIGIGAFVMLGSGKKVKPSTPLAPSSGTSVATAPKPAPAPPKPVPASPSPTVSKSSSSTASQSSTQFPPGKWVKVFTKVEDLPEHLRKPDSGVKFEDGWILAGDTNIGLRLIEVSVKNTGIRARVRFDPDSKGYEAFSLRVSPAGRLTLSRDRTGDLHRISWINDKSQPRLLATFDLGRSFMTGEHVVEFAVFGNQAICRFDDRLHVAKLADGLEPGSSSLGGSEDLRDIEVINLDGLSEAEALKILGVDEKGNDLRQKPAAVASATPAASRSTPGTATKDAPFTNTLGMKFVPVPGTNVLMGIHETRRRDYDAYAKAVPGVDPTWKAPVYDGTALVQTDDHPVVMVGWEDAKAFADWLSRQEGNRYRLPTEHEWNLAVVTGLTTPESTSPAEVARLLSTQYPWGTAKLEDGDKLGNYKGSQDGFAGTAPVMSFPANPLGIHDLGGNAWEWCLDLFEKGKDWNVIRGGGFMNYGPPRKSSWRVGVAPNFRAPPRERL